MQKNDNVRCKIHTSACHNIFYATDDCALFFFVSSEKHTVAVEKRFSRPHATLDATLFPH
jgi:hypothetical protein